MSQEKGSESVYENTNGMPMQGGKNLHMDLGNGDVANRIVVCGSESRVLTVSKHFDAQPPPVTIKSSRGFTTVTGKYKGEHVSAVSIGMGLPMMDFFVREVRAVTDGPIAVIRFGTCGGLSAENAKEGTVVVAGEGSLLVTRNYDFFASTNSERTTGDSPYLFHNKVLANSDLSARLMSKLEENCGPECVHSGLNVTADSFYSSQNRIDPRFDDANSSVVDDILSKHPTALTMEMETYMLFHLAHCSKIPIFAAAASIVVANRKSSHVIDESSLHSLELKGGEACLQALIEQKL